MIDKTIFYTDEKIIPGYPDYTADTKGNIYSYANNQRWRHI